MWHYIGPWICSVELRTLPDRLRQPGRSSARARWCHVRARLLGGGSHAFIHEQTIYPAGSDPSCKGLCDVRPRASCATWVGRRRTTAGYSSRRRACCRSSARGRGGRHCALVLSPEARPIFIQGEERISIRSRHCVTSRGHGAAMALSAYGSMGGRWELKMSASLDSSFGG
jgi:hypothetical protein